MVLRFWMQSMRQVLLGLFGGTMAMIALAMLAGRLLPPGDMMAYMSNESLNWDIYVMDVSRRLTHQLTHADTNERYPAWSPDGQQIAFHSDRNNGEWILYVMDADGRNQRQLIPLVDETFTPTPTPDPETGAVQVPVRVPAVSALFGRELAFSQGSAMAAWSPDGQRVAFHADREGDWDLLIYDLETGEIDWLIDRSQDDVLLAWSPDGRRVAYSSEQFGAMDLFVLDLETGEERRLTGMDEVIDTSSITQMRDRNGNLITPTPAPPIGSGQSTAPTGIPPGEAQAEWHASWSPDGQRLVYAAGRATSTDDLYIIDVDSGEITRLTDTFYDNNNPVWLPDGEHIAFTSDRDGTTQIYIMDMTGEVVQRLTHDPSSYFDAPAWRP